MSGKAPASVKRHGATGRSEGKEGRLFFAGEGETHMLFRSIGLACLLAATAGIVRAEDGTPTSSPLAASSAPVATELQVAPYPHAAVVVHPDDQPATDREMLDLPTRHWLVDFRLAGTQTTHIDPYANYQHQGTGWIDDGNSLLATQRLARTLLAPAAYIVYGNPQPTSRPAG